MGETKRVKIALVNPPPPSLLAFVDYQYPLIGLAYMAAVLEKNGYDVTVVDAPAYKMTYKETEHAIRRFEPDIVGITSVAATFTSAIQVAKDIKTSCPRALTVFGGPHATVMDKQIISENEEVDVVVRGEGEQTIADLARYASNSGLKNLNEVEGITFRKEGGVVRTPDRPLIQNLDELPFPAYHYFPLRKYQIFRKLGLPMVTVPRNARSATCLRLRGTISGQEAQKTSLMSLSGHKMNTKLILSLSPTRYSHTRKNEYLKSVQK